MVMECRTRSENGKESQTIRKDVETAGDLWPFTLRTGGQADLHGEEDARRNTGEVMELCKNKILPSISGNIWKKEEKKFDCRLSSSF